MIHLFFFIVLIQFDRWLINNVYSNKTKQGYSMFLSLCLWGYLEDIDWNFIAMCTLNFGFLLFYIIHCQTFSNKNHINRNITKSGVKNCVLNDRKIKLLLGTFQPFKEIWINKKLILFYNFLICEFMDVSYVWTS